MRLSHFVPSYEQPCEETLKSLQNNLNRRFTLQGSLLESLKGEQMRKSQILAFLQRLNKKFHFLSLTKTMLSIKNQSWWIKKTVNKKDREPLTGQYFRVIPYVSLNKGLQGLKNNRFRDLTQIGSTQKEGQVDVQAVDKYLKPAFRASRCERVWR